jgi:hypothetical protein
VLVDELRQAIALEKHAEQIEGHDLALQHDAVDEEHRDRFTRTAHRTEKNFLKQCRLLLLELFREGTFDFGEIERLGRHDRRNGMFVDELGLAVAAQQHREIIEPGDDALELHTLHQEHGDGCLRAPQAVQEHILEVVDLIGHIPLSLLAGCDPRAAPRRATKLGSRRRDFTRQAAALSFASSLGSACRGAFNLR